MERQFREWIADADLVLIGVGKEFEEETFRVKEEALQALNNLAGILEKKNYFAITICTNDILKASRMQSDRVVQPCGTVAWKQCINRCNEGLMQLTEEEGNALQEKLTLENTAQPEGLYLGKCPICGSPLVLNTVYTENYDENGYLKDWNRYTKWLQGTVNKKLVILELGVDLTYPSIIRWPFEKVAFYNQKARFVRVNKRLYHMSEEIKDKGVSIAENAVQWLLKEEETDCDSNH